MKDPTSTPKAARPDDSPFASLTRALDARLRAEAPSSFAGMARKTDGSFEVYTTVSDPTLIAVVEGVRAESGYQGVVRVVPGMKNSLLSLEAVFARVKGRSQELHDEGVGLVQFGVNILANRVGLGVEGLTPDIAESLRREFGPDQVTIFEGQRFRAV
jgi:hypothetical protein